MSAEKKAIPLIYAEKLSPNRNISAEKLSQFSAEKTTNSPRRKRALTRTLSFLLLL
jgi:hypothetical protein